MKDLDDSTWSECVDVIRRACEAGAAASHRWIGRMEIERADADASSAMRDTLRELRVAARVVAGEGEKDGGEHLAVGEVFAGIGSGIGIGLDLAVDPIEGTTNLAQGLPWALTVAGATQTGAMLETGPSLYMEKLVVPAAAALRIDPLADTATRLNCLASAIGKPVSSLRIFVLNKPRHKALAAEIVRAGAQVALFGAGDVVGTIAVALGEQFDAVMGIGGTPEGMLSACAVRAVGGGFFARLAPQRPDEAAAMKLGGVVADRWLEVGELIRSSRSVFCAAGITESPLAAAARIEEGGLAIETRVILGPGGRVSRGTRTVRGPQPFA